MLVQRKLAIVAAVLGSSLALSCAGRQGESAQAEHGAHDHGHHQVSHSETSASDDGALLVFDAPPAVGTRARCPVTGEIFEVTDTTPRVEHRGRHYVLCCEGCRPAFEADPDSYAGGDASGS